MNENNKNESTIKNEVKHLIQKGYSYDHQLYNILKNKYDDNSIVDLILEEFKIKKRKLEKLANHFIKKFQTKFGNDMSMKLVLKKILKYKKKYDLSDEEFDNVKQQFEKKLYNENNQNFDYNINNSNLSKVLGSPYSNYNQSLNASSNEDFKNVQEIIKLNRSTRSLYSQILLQTSTYQRINEDLPHLLKSSHFDINKHSLNFCINPVIAALFIHKFPEIEMRMLYSNIAEIIEYKYENKPIDTEPNSRLLYYLVNDPSDVVCSSKSALEDLKERAIVQIQLWQNVINLRNGKLYDPVTVDFFNAIDNCKISNYDNPDLIILGNEGVILRRLFNIFSFRPIVVQTMPFITNYNNNPYNTPSMNNLISTIPYITKRIQPNVVQNGQQPNVQQQNLSNYLNSDRNPNDINLDENTQFTQYYLENNIFIMKLTTIIYLYGPLIFYVPRRSISVPMILPHTLRNLPMTKYSNLKTLNYTLNIFPLIKLKHINDKTEHKILKSIVSLESKSLNIQNYNNNIQENFIAGNITYIMIKNNNVNLNINDQLILEQFINSYMYSPQSVLHLSNIEKKPIMKFTDVNDNANDEQNQQNHIDSVISNITQYGTIFIYDNQDNDNNNRII